MSIIHSPSPLWTPSPDDSSGFSRYLDWLRQKRGHDFTGYHEAWEWSTTGIEEFWGSLWEFFEIGPAVPPDRVLERRRMPGARWFAGAELNYAAIALRHGDAEKEAILYRSEREELKAMSWRELRRQVGAVAASFREMGVERGDRVVAYMPNIPQTVVAFLAAASIGAIWSSCSPDFGAESAVERFRQIEPKILLAVDGYVYAGKEFDRKGTVEKLMAALPSLVAVVLVPNLDGEASLSGTRTWASLLDGEEAPSFASLRFDHPLWILYSSGTTGAPKAIVHGHGGIVLEHLKIARLQSDLRLGDTMFLYTTTGWMMWNRLVGGLLAGASIVLFDGSPASPDLGALWRLVESTGTTHFGAGAGFFVSCMNEGLEPRSMFDLRTLRMISSTGSPLPGAAFRWVYSSVKSDIWLASSSGGTDVATAFLGACPTLPVYEEELQGAALGVRALAFDDAGHPVVDEVGELVIVEPIPSMPLCFWNDADDRRYRESYFDRWPGIWRHGDWVRFNRRGGAIIVGRSDSTLNRHGIRIGTAEIYSAVESTPGVRDSLVIGLELPDGGYYMPLFVVLEDGLVLDAKLVEAIRLRLRSGFTARHLPDEIIRIDAVPRTLNGKKLEVPVKKILLGQPVDRVVNSGALANPESLRFFVELAERRREERG